MVSLLDAWERKLKVASMLERMLSSEEIEQSKKDGHSQRLPRPCGLTIHTGIGCSFGCIYCYIYDMGFTKKPKPYPLSALQISYAISINPSIALGIDGTPLAFGSITEPFMVESRDRALEYMRSISSYLKNPIQFSTKAFIDRSLANEIKRSTSNASGLVTIVTNSLYKLLEPNAPSPHERFKSIENLSGAGIHTSLFLRPILPGVRMDEFQEIIAKALDAGAKGVVLGSMRVTEGILRRLRSIKYPYMDEVLKRAPRNIKGSKQVTLSMLDLKRSIQEIANRLNAKVYPSACAASMDAYNLSCNACDMGPCGDPKDLPSFELDEVNRLGRYYELDIQKVALDNALKIKASGNINRIYQLVEFLKWVTKRKVLVTH